MFTPRCLPVLIGSLPLFDHFEAARIIFEYTPDIPLWPQLPKNEREGMVRQFLTGFPGLREEKNSFWIDTEQSSFTDEMTSFYEDYLQAETDAGFLRESRFRLGKDTASGFAALLKMLDSGHTGAITLKGQITGPVTTGIGTRDQKGNSIFYDDNLRDMLVKHLSLKGRWQVFELLRYTTHTPPIILIDEPGMVSFGSSAFTGISKEMVIAAVSEVIEAIQQAGGLAGVHICANGDWAPALDSGADIISFDAYSYFENFILFREPLIRFIKRGGILAWGITPTGDPRIVASENSDSLFTRWRQQLCTLASFGFAETLLMEQTLIAPACGTGSLPLDLAIKVLSMNREVSEKCRNYLQTKKRD